MPGRIIIVAKRSAYQRYVREQRDPVARQLLRRRDPTVARWREAHEDHVRTLREVERIAKRLLGSAPWVIHGPRIRFDARDAAVVVTVGGDGTLLAASHHVGSNVPVLGINSSRDHSVGFFCAAYRETAEAMLAAAYAKRLPKVRLARMEVMVNERSVSKRVLNEALFCHATPAATSRYIIEHAGIVEEQRSSGIWIGPAAGSTGALRAAGGKILAFSSKKLQLVVREPYLLDAQRYRLQHRIVAAGDSVVLHNKMHDAKLFLDGPFLQIRVGLGDRVLFRTSDESLKLLGFTADRQIAAPRP